MSLELRAITKSFGPLIANDGIDLKVADGEIHAILGENGAGKSTLMNVVYGLLKPDSGTIAVDGKEISISSPSDALAAGIGMVHQHFMLIPVFTVAENIVLGKIKLARHQVPGIKTSLHAEHHGFALDHTHDQIDVFLFFFKTYRRDAHRIKNAQTS